MGTIYETELLVKTHHGSMHPGGLRLSARAVRLAGLTAGMRVADIGCGTGVTAAFLSEKLRLNVTGLDKSDKLIAMGLKSWPGLNLIRWSGETFPFEENCLDAIFFECTLSVIGSIKQILASCAKALKRTGAVIISDVYAKQSLNTNSTPLLTEDELKCALTGAGFDIVVQEDHTAALRTYIAGLRENSRNSLDACSFFGTSCNRESIRLSELGYILLIARKI
ncbi:MAG: class I SAM-dependent methyltransferase [Clostridiales bacterium]|nr:class I SAM-dependent methyltransferase [Clostridiales bacterium]